jgi:hypothetical protein
MAKDYALEQQQIFVRIKRNGYKNSFTLKAILCCKSQFQQSSLGHVSEIQMSLRNETSLYLENSAPCQNKTQLQCNLSRQRFSEPKISLGGGFTQL